MTAKVFLKNRWEELLLLLLAVLFFLLRFLYLSQVPFINDEPALQLLLEKHMASGTLPVLGLAGSVGLRYGPSALWLYWPIRLFTHDVNFLTAAYCCYFGIGFALLFLAIKRSLGGRVAAWTLLFASSSPYLFFYSRLAWDNPLLVLFLPMMAHALSLWEQRCRISVAAYLGFSAGMAISLHLMAAPAVLGAFLLVVRKLALQQGKQRTVLFISGAFSFLLPVVPYLWGLSHSTVFSGSPATNSFLSSTSNALSALVRYLSVSGMEYFFDLPKERVAEAAGPIAAFLLQFDPGALWKIFSWIGLAQGLLWIRRGGSPLLLQFALLSGLGTFCLLTFLALSPFHPHYSMGSWWIGFLFLAFFLERLPSGLRPLLKISTLFLIVWNLLFVISAFSSIKNNGGTRGLHYGTDAEASQSKIRELCSRLSSDGKVGARLDLRDVPGILPYSLIYFFKHTPECAKKDLKFWPDSEGENSLSFRLNYSGGSARWDLH